MTQLTSLDIPQLPVLQRTNRLIMNDDVSDHLPEHVIKKLSLAVKELPEEYTLVVSNTNPPYSVLVSLTFTSGKIMNIGQPSRLFESSVLTSFEQWTFRNVLRNAMLVAGFTHVSHNWQRFSYMSLN